MADFNSFDQVETWVSEHGIDDMRRAVGLPRFAGQSLAMARVWLAEYDRKALEAEQRAAIAEARRATAAAERSARWTFWAAVAAAIGALATWAQALLPLLGSMR